MSPPRPSTAVEPEADEQDQESLLKTFLATTQHFFGSVTDRFILMEAIDQVQDGVGRDTGRLVSEIRGGESVGQGNRAQGGVAGINNP